MRLIAPLAVSTNERLGEAEPVREIEPEPVEANLSESLAEPTRLIAPVADAGKERETEAVAVRLIAPDPETVKVRESLADAVRLIEPVPLVETVPEL